MARIDIIIAKLPALIADRTDALKIETAIRYVGDIIFDASQNQSCRQSQRAAASARFLSLPEEAQFREADFNAFPGWVPGPDTPTIPH